MLCPPLQIPSGGLGPGLLVLAPTGPHPAIRACWGQCNIQPPQAQKFGQPASASAFRSPSSVSNFVVVESNPQPLRARHLFAFSAVGGVVLHALRARWGRRRMTLPPIRPSSFVKRVVAATWPTLAPCGEFTPALCSGPRGGDQSPPGHELPSSGHLPPRPHTLCCFGSACWRGGSR